MYDTFLWCKYTLARTKGLSDFPLCGDLNDSSISVGYYTPQAQVAAPWVFCASVGVVACCLPFSLCKTVGKGLNVTQWFFFGGSGHISKWHTNREWYLFASFYLSPSPSLFFYPCSLSVSAFLQDLKYSQINSALIAIYQHTL